MLSLDKIIDELSINEKKVLLALDKLSGSASPKTIMDTGDFHKQVEVMNAASWLQSKKLVKVEETIQTVFELGKEGKLYVKKGLPEKRAIKHIVEKGGQCSIGDLSEVLEKGRNTKVC